MKTFLPDSVVSIFWTNTIGHSIASKARLMAVQLPPILVKKYFYFYCVFFFFSVGSSHTMLGDYGLGDLSGSTMFVKVPFHKRLMLVKISPLIF